jgi:hypothetical protein
MLQKVNDVRRQVAASTTVAPSVLLKLLLADFSCGPAQAKFLLKIARPLVMRAFARGFPIVTKALQEK